MPSLYHQTQMLLSKVSLSEPDLRNGSVYASDGWLAAQRRPGVSGRARTRVPGTSSSSSSTGTPPRQLTTATSSVPGGASSMEDQLCLTRSSENTNTKTNMNTNTNTMAYMHIYSYMPVPGGTSQGLPSRNPTVCHHPSRPKMLKNK